MTIDVLPRLEVIADEHRLKSHGLGQASEVEQLAGRELFGRRLVSELEHHDVFPVARVES